MALNRERLDAVAKPRPTENVRRAKERVENREWMRNSKFVLDTSPAYAAEEITTS